MSAHKRLDDAIARRDQASKTVQRLQGRLAAALETLTEVEAECVSRGVPPDKLDEAIKQLEKRYESAVSTFEREVALVEGKLATFM